MIKKLYLCAVILSLSFAFTLFAAEEIQILMKQDDPWMSVNAVRQEIDPGRGTAPLNIGGRILVPIRAIIEAFDGEINWDEDSEQISIAANGHQVSMWLNKQEISVDGQNKTMDIAPQSIAGRTMVPLRFAAENVGCEVTWLPESSEIILRLAVKTETSLEEMTPPVQPAAPTISTDREGNRIELPAKIERIISMGPSNTEVLVGLGCGDRIIATDSYSSNVEGIDPAIALFSMMNPDGERIIELEPDVIFVTGMSKVGGDDPLQLIKDVGICVIYIPSSSSIEGIKEDIRYLAEVMGATGKASDLISIIETGVAEVTAIAADIAEERTVYFEISAAPYMYSFGSGVFLNEMIELIGGRNIFVDQEGWISVADEAILEANPEVILTSVNYIDDVLGEIKARPGWDVISAIEEDRITIIDTDASNRPSHHIVKALWEMAIAIYPEYYSPSGE